MGYTHYWKYKKTIPIKAWKKIIKDCQYLAECAKETGIEINGCFKFREAQFTDDYIWFNGGSAANRTKDSDGDFNNDIELAHETFVFKREKPNDFCKTYRKPYDLLVSACLIIIKCYAPGVGISSDGDLGDADWQKAFEFVKKYLPGKESKLYTNFIDQELAYQA